MIKLLTFPLLPLHSYVSPRARAQRTLELLDVGCRDNLPWTSPSKPPPHESIVRTNAKVQITPDIREWDYGDYEGLTSHQIREQRKETGEPVWDIWKDGCPGGESPEDVAKRLDRLIGDIRGRWHEGIMNAHGGKVEDTGETDVLLVAHGHILRAFAMRWIGKGLTEGVSLLLEGMSFSHPSKSWVARPARPSWLKSAC